MAGLTFVSVLRIQKILGLTATDSFSKSEKQREDLLATPRNLTYFRV